MKIIHSIAARIATVFKLFINLLGVIPQMIFCNILKIIMAKALDPMLNDGPCLFIISWIFATIKKHICAHYSPQIAILAKAAPTHSITTVEPATYPNTTSIRTSLEWV